MTILPKKKPTQKEKCDPGLSESPPHSPGGPGESLRGTSRRPGSPSGLQGWNSPPPLDHSVDLASRYGEDSGHGAGANNKRRLRERSPPHRHTRKQRHERGGATVGSTGHMAGSSHSRQAGFRSPTNVASTSDVRGNTSGTAIGAQVIGEVDDEHNSGYNSEDECGPHPCDADSEEVERRFEAALEEKRGFIIKKMGDDGACLFRAVADQVYGDQEMHSVVRQNCVDYMSKNVDFFKQYVTEDFMTYLNRKRSDHCHGNHIEMHAICEMYNRPIEVYTSSVDPINTFHGSYQTDNEPIRLSYHRNVHYNSVVDPRKATIGVGLGLPGLQPGIADKNLIRDAVRQSEDCHIEQTMLEDKLRETDWELTQETIEEQVLRESYLQFLRDQERSDKMKASTSTACSSTSENPGSNWWESGASSTTGDSKPARSPRNQSGQMSPHAASPGRISPRVASGSQDSSPSYVSTSGFGLAPEGAVGGMAFPETVSLMNELPEQQVFGMSDWVDDEDGILAQVIAQSQQEYLTSLKKSALASKSSTNGATDSSTDDGKSPKDGCP